MTRYSVCTKHGDHFLTRAKFLLEQDALAYADKLRREGETVEVRSVTTDPSANVRRLIPDADAAVTYLRDAGYNATFAGLDAYGIAYWTAWKATDEVPSERRLYTSLSIVDLARGHWLTYEGQPAKQSVEQNNEALQGLTLWARREYEASHDDKACDDERARRE